jgi:hypothetical protein
VDWIAVADEKRERYGSSYGELDERALVRRGNVAYAAALALTMAGDPGAVVWFRKAAAAWRTSWEQGAAADAWGRPIGVLKAGLLAGDDVGSDAVWTLELGAAAALSPIGRYAALLALLALERRDEAAHLAVTLRDFPAGVAAALAAIAACNEDAYGAALDSVVASFESRPSHLEDVPVADTALALDALALRNGLARPLPASRMIPPG